MAHFTLGYLVRFSSDLSKLLFLFLLKSSQKDLLSMWGYLLCKSNRETSPNRGVQLPLWERSYKARWATSLLSGSVYQGWSLNCRECKMDVMSKTEYICLKWSMCKQSKAATMFCVPQYQVEWKLATAAVRESWEPLDVKYLRWRTYLVDYRNSLTFNWWTGPIGV